MKRKKAERIIKIYNWVRFIIVILFIAFVLVALTMALTRQSRETPSTIKAHPKVSANTQIYFISSNR